MLVTLARQSFVVNQFPFSLSNRQASINQTINENKALEARNKIKLIELKAQSARDSEVLESQARYRFNLIKDGETYYQINNPSK